jgi:hypothetical protein
MENPEPFNDMIIPGNTVMVLHGPEIIDSGDAACLTRLIRPVRIIVSGVMARTAAEESGLPVEFSGIPPSMTMRDLHQRCFLANQGKTPLSGRVFGEIVASRLAPKGLVHLESADRCIYLWNDGDEALAEALGALTGFAMVRIRSRYRSDEVREIRGCIPGEAVFVNGIVIGTATEETVRIGYTDGHLVPLSGLIPKAHGLEKLGPVRIDTAWCKSGSIRSAAPSVRRPRRPSGRILVVDHCAHEIYQRIGPDVCGILSIGDDTTAVCGHIGAHMGIPVFGVVDGDMDLVVPYGNAQGSVLVEALEERDDDLGREIAGELSDGEICWREWVEEMLDRLGDRVRVKRVQYDPELGCESEK